MWRCHTDFTGPIGGVELESNSKTDWIKIFHRLNLTHCVDLIALDAHSAKYYIIVPTKIKYLKLKIQY